MIYINTRNLKARLTGVQRYTLELLSRLGNRVEQIAPQRNSSGIEGHLWEQIVLPILLRGHLLWSPANTGPLAVRKQVVTVHDATTIDHPEWFNPRFAAWYRFLIPKLVRRACRVITVSDFTRRRLLEIAPVPEDQIVAIPNGVGVRFYPRSDDQVEVTRTALGLPSPYYVLSIGSLEPRKNLLRLLEAWSHAQQYLPDEIWLIVAGGVGDPRIFRTLNMKVPITRVHFSQQIPDMHLPALYSGAIALVYPSIYEGFGFPPLEAMACGTAVLTSNVTSLPEVVGDAGLLVDPYDVEAIADGIRCLVEDSTLREELRLEGLKRAKQFSWERTAKLTWSVLQESMERA